LVLAFTHLLQRFALKPKEELRRNSSLGLIAKTKRGVVGATATPPTRGVGAKRPTTPLIT
jgi:hypothetical protein